jgi:hypothetical protein
MDGTRSETSERVAERDPINVVVAPGVWMRRRQWSTPVSAAFWAANAVFYVGAGIFALTLPNRGSTLSMVAVMLTFAAFVASSAWAAVRLPRAGLRIGPEGVTLRNVFRTRELGLAEVDRFIPGVFSAGLMRGSVGVKVKRHHHAFYLLVYAMRSTEDSDKKSTEAALADWQVVCDELNGLLSAMKGEAAPKAGGGAAEVLTRERAERTYRLVQLSVVCSAMSTLFVAVVGIALGMILFSEILLALGAVGYLLIAPLALARYRRGLYGRIGKPLPPG